MKATRMYLLLHIFSSTGVLLVNACNPLVTTVVVGVGATLGWAIYLYFQESCGPRWIAFNATGLKLDLDSRLFGQHVASRVVMKAVNNFMNIDSPAKPLVLALQGTSGTGKNFVSQLIAENIYKEGMNSSFVHFFSPVYHFPHGGQIDTYKSQLQQWIKGSVTKCERSMFIFDEMDKMHPGLIESIKPYLDYYTKLDGVSYRKAIFIFISNAGGDAITDTTLDFLREGRKREEIQLKDLEKALSASTSDSINSDLWRSQFIRETLLDFFVPFLPLEYPHVVQCVMAEMKARGLRPDQDVANNLARDLEYFPKLEKVFSVKGCKTIESKLDFYV